MNKQRSIVALIALCITNAALSAPTLTQLQTAAKNVGKPAALLTASALSALLVNNLRQEAKIDYLITPGTVASAVGKLTGTKKPRPVLNISKQAATSLIPTALLLGMSVKSAIDVWKETSSEYAKLSSAPSKK